MHSDIGGAAVADTIRDEAITAALTDLESGVATLRNLNYQMLPNLDRMHVLKRLETIARTLPALGHTLINQLIEQRACDTLGGANLSELLADALHITPTAASQRIHVARQLGTQTAFGGQPLDPEMPATAAATHQGAINPAHVEVIRTFLRHLPAAIDCGTRDQAEHDLAAHARTLRPDELKVAADRLANFLDPDGKLDDEADRARKSYFRMGKQGKDKMTKGSFCVDPETRAYLEAIFAKAAKPGMCNPADDDDPDGSTSSGDATDPVKGGADGSTDRGRKPNPPGEPGTDDGSAPNDSPPTDFEPSEAATARDTRPEGQRQHDALKKVLRSVLASGELGQHRGLPVTVIVTMTLSELESAMGVAITGGGSLLPMKDAIRLAAHAHHYLAIFDDDDGRPLYLARTKRLATGDQRIILYAKDRGCTFPGCTKPGCKSQAHHRKEWADGGETNADDLTFGCEDHHPLVGDGDHQWATTRAGPDHPYPGRTLWHPPTHIDPTRTGRINHYHHPGEYLMHKEDSAGDDEPRKPHAA